MNYHLVGRDAKGDRVEVAPFLRKPNIKGRVGCVFIEGTVGYNYLIQMSTNLFNTNAWITMTNFTLTQPIQYWDDIRDVSTKPGRYYRVLPGQ